ncbi:hypothetical protein CV83915_2p0266 (plasmid) [Escherichia coli]|uniref:Uncharacterized protein n=1 Tax=Escherichia coli TaxID=562 RepID=A0A2H4TL72_ECOLX|nr:hypothetical protein CV83915_2p0266 [Escherichia coli]
MGNTPGFPVGWETGMIRMSRQTEPPRKSWRLNSLRKR